jgi:hypothetical protein
MNRLLILTLILAMSALGAKKPRDWKTGHVLDSNSSQQSYVVGAVTNTSGSATGLRE